MSASTAIATANLFSETEALTREAVYNAAKARLQNVEASQGKTTPIGQLPPTPAKAGDGGVLSSVEGALTDPLNIIAPGAGLVEKGLEGVGLPNPLEAAKGVVSGAVSGVAGEVVNGVLGLVKPIALKLALYAGLIFGAVLLMLYGLSEMIKPIGGPDLAAGARKLGKDAVIAGAAE